MFTAFILLLRKLPLSFYLTIFAVVVISAGYFFWKGKIVAAVKSQCESEKIARENEVLQRQAEEFRQYILFLEEKKAENEKFISRQRKALEDAQEQDGDVAPVLRGTIDRLRDD